MGGFFVDSILSATNCHVWSDVWVNLCKTIHGPQALTWQCSAFPRNSIFDVLVIMETVVSYKKPPRAVHLSTRCLPFYKFFYDVAGSSSFVAQTSSCTMLQDRP